jgi:UDP-N-acetylmuramate--alanine ligase
VPGEFNIYNALAAAACAYICGIDGKTVAEALSSFKGAGRRFEYKGTINNAKVYEDYAHHPTAIEKTLRGIKKLNCNKIWCVLQPHTYSRTHELLDDLIKSLSHADNIILTEIFSANEVNIYNISSRDIAAKIENAVFIDDFAEIAKYLKNNVRDNDIVIVMGAGDINKLFEYMF